MTSDSKQKHNNEKWDEESEQNWENFWQAILKEDMRQNSQLYLKNKNIKKINKKHER